MTVAEVQWVLDTIRENWDLPAIGYGDGGFGGPTYSGTSFSDVPMVRVDRDESLVLDSPDEVDLDQPLHERSGELEDANYISATLADRSTTAIGTEYDHQVEVVVGVRIEGLHHSEWGHIDPNGENGLVWDEVCRTARDALLTERTWPAVDSSDGTYTHLMTANEVDTSSDWKDAYRYDFDVVLEGYRELP